MRHHKTLRHTQKKAKDTREKERVCGRRERVREREREWERGEGTYPKKPQHA
jgi:hypothetical protein